MKNRFDLTLLLLFCLSVPACKWAGDADIRWLLILPGLPVFSLQLLILRRTGEPALRLFPVWLLILFALTGGIIVLVGNGWEPLLGWIMLLASIAPAVALGLAWAGYTLCARHPIRKEDSHG